MKNILITGSNGFLGKNLYQNFTKNPNYRVFGLGRQEGLEKDFFKKDIRSNFDFGNFTFDTIVHAAGKAHRHAKTKKDIDDFYNVNYTGTKNLLTALKNLVKLPELFVFISTVAVYGRIQGKLINENFETTPEDPYGKSKLKAEKYIIDWCLENNVEYLILRLPLVVGHFPPGNLGKMINAIGKNRYARIKGNKCRKSVVLGNDISKFLIKNNQYNLTLNLTDGFHPQFNEIEDSLCKMLNSKIYFSMPLRFLWIIGVFGGLLNKIGVKFPVNRQMVLKMTSELTFDDSKARQIAGWRSNSAIDFIKNELKY